MVGQVGIGWPAEARSPRELNGPVTAEAGDQLLAGLGAASTGLCTDPAMFVHLGVPPALIGAGPADGHACLERGAGQVGVIAGAGRAPGP